MKSHILRPDAFAIGLFIFGFVMFFLPLMRMPGFIAMLAALGYWLTMTVIKAFNRRHP